MNDAVVSLLPLAIVTILIFLLARPMQFAVEKGKATASLICLVPVIGRFALIYFASLTDRKILDRLTALEANRANR